MTTDMQATDAQIARHIESFERVQAEERKRSSLKQNRGAESAQRAERTSNGRTRQKVAAAVGMSHDTLSKAQQVVATGTPELRKAMDAGEVSVDAAAKLEPVHMSVHVEKVKLEPVHMSVRVEEAKLQPTMVLVRDGDCRG